MTYLAARQGRVRKINIEIQQIVTKRAMLPAISAVVAAHTTVTTVSRG
jgi:hypothetical protein